MREREKQTFSGPLLELDFYPVLDDGRRLPTRGPKTSRTSEEQRKYNAKVTTKKIIRTVNANFNGSDYFFHPTYLPWLAPQDEQQARRDIVNYFRRVKRARAKALAEARRELADAEAAAASLRGNRFVEGTVAALRKKVTKLEEPFRYLYVIEQQIYKSGDNAGRVNWHFHAFCTGGLDAAVMEDLWLFGVRVNCMRFNPERFGPEAAGRYISKDPQGARRFAGSRNLVRPVERHRTGRISPRTVERLAKEKTDDAAWWEKRYPGYRFLCCYSRFNEYNGYWYVSAVMYRAGGGSPPPWVIEDWITEGEK